MAAKNPPARKCMHLNFVHNDEIWKDHVRHEMLSQLHRWPEKWGYLVNEYSSMNGELAGGSHSATRKATIRDDCESTDGVKLPPITVPAPRKDQGFPVTTSQLIGWKSARCGSKKDTRYDTRAQGLMGILNLLKWPGEGSN